MRPRVPTRVYATDEIRAIEGAAMQGPDALPLMERAGLAVAEAARERLGERSRVLVVAGPGNNGGDALVAARHLSAWWYRVDVVFAGDAGKLPGDARQALERWCAAGGTPLQDIPARGPWDLVLDGLFGIGLQRDLEGRYRELVARVNGIGAPVLAIDLPSGLCSDTGRMRGAAVRAERTVTFIALKPGLLTLDGPDCCGDIQVADLGLPDEIFPEPTLRVIEREAAVAALPRRRRNSHKGTHGDVGILGGAPSMVGAALLAGRSALRAGAGRVFVAPIGDDAPAVDAAQPELMLRAPEALFQLANLDCLAVGPGLGMSPDACQWLQAALESPWPLVLDADALNLMARLPRLREQLAQRGNATLTPHPAEAARLLDLATADVQADRIAAARKLAALCGCGVVLKGVGSVCAFPRGPVYLNTTGNPGMASAGMGDVLTGLIAGLAAQGAGLEQALQLAVHLHGAAADHCVAQGLGPIGLTALETADAARVLLNRWVYPPPDSV
ncbi:MAG: NAD(P)H-hydrate dehydratase [Pseudomonadota bacterium]